ncbi:hypothetical protein BH11PSE13_BH11PSE13_20680 [soil metagenome]
MKTTVCTLFEGHYHYGVAGLVNSLAAAGYEGTVWVGHRGPLPSWIVGGAGFDSTAKCLQVTPKVRLQTVELNPPMSLTYFKPTFMLDILERLAPDTGAICYVDPDIVVKCDWTAIEQWVPPDGIALVEDLHWAMPAQHPKRARWQEFFASHGETPVRPLERYYNAGFVGVARAQIDVLRAWKRICGIVAAYSGGSLQQRRVGERDHLFHSTDEDALNFTLSLSAIQLATLGPEAMDLTPGGKHLSHAVGSFKPWQGHHVRRALQGQPPTVAGEWFYHFAAGPISPFTRLHLAKRRAAMRVALALGKISTFLLVIQDGLLVHPQGRAVRREAAGYPSFEVTSR